MKISTDLIKKLREETGAPVIRVKKVLEELKGNEKKAIEILKKEGFEKAAKRQDRETTQGLVETYMHHSGKVASIVEILCETDFVSRNELFKDLAHNIALQIASMDPKDIQELENQESIKDPSKKISDLVKEVIAKTGENIRIGRFFRVELGKK
ncbi:translation elongation factor Ts [Candidatus Woesebacteria bacterium RBG_16_36_11]|uniref:Elongation factor Ts n=3 Tax=Candidatus Woeseibacteriota TaxID=1752722 RepID=A0A1F7XBX4_9BACT|nr:MAG: translation elongation factor Ts [Candidatus Woesebacteria bacterium RBG_13_36_22]OGM12463.1 MAG: translation elongation factor Ts [Candidatus Woesebacteria bacterium RBG_16_36_11]OGM15642.1 MAG: translation elongation factor Ts [Candidatus Woesebacteria bacterium RBG_19FT_COMBO_37_29]